MYTRSVCDTKAPLQLRVAALYKCLPSSNGSSYLLHVPYTEYVHCPIAFIGIWAGFPTVFRRSVSLYCVRISRCEEPAGDKVQLPFFYHFFTDTIREARQFRRRFLHQPAYLLVHREKGPSTLCGCDWLKRSQSFSVMLERN